MNISTQINFANAQVEPWSNNVHIYLAVKGYNRTDIVSGLTFSTYQEGEGVITPEPLKLTKPAAQVLLDALYQAGIRPSNHAAGDSTVEALKKHLEDMRTLVFKEPKP